MCKSRSQAFNRTLFFYVIHFFLWLVLSLSLSLSLFLLRKKREEDVVCPMSTESTEDVARQTQALRDKSTNDSSSNLHSMWMTPISSIALVSASKRIHCDRRIHKDLQVKDAAYLFVAVAYNHIPVLRLSPSTHSALMLALLRLPTSNSCAQDDCRPVVEDWLQTLKEQ